MSSDNLKPAVDGGHARRRRLQGWVFDKTALACALWPLLAIPGWHEVANLVAMLLTIASLLTWGLHRARTRARRRAMLAVIGSALPAVYVAWTFADHVWAGIPSILAMALMAWIALSPPRVTFSVPASHLPRLGASARTIRDALRRVVPAAAADRHMPSGWSAIRRRYPVMDIDWIGDTTLSIKLLPREVDNRPPMRVTVQVLPPSAGPDFDVVAVGDEEALIRWHVAHAAPGLIDAERDIDVRRQDGRWRVVVLRAVPSAMSPEAIARELADRYAIEAEIEVRDLRD